MLVFFFIDHFILFFIEFNTLKKILDRGYGVVVFVIRRVDFILFYIGFDHFWIVAYRLDKKYTKTIVCGTIVVNKLTSFARSVGRIKYLFVKKRNLQVICKNQNREDGLLFLPQLRPHCSTSRTCLLKLL